MASDLYWIAMVALSLTEINLVRSQIWRHLPFLTLETPGLHGRNLLRLLCECTYWSDLKENAIVSTGEGTILALEPFITLDRERAEQPPLTSSHNT